MLGEKPIIIIISILILIIIIIGSGNTICSKYCQFVIYLFVISSRLVVPPRHMGIYGAHSLNPRGRPCPLCPPLPPCLAHSVTLAGSAPVQTSSAYPTASSKAAKAAMASSAARHGLVPDAPTSGAGGGKGGGWKLAVTMR